MEKSKSFESNHRIRSGFIIPAARQQLGKEKDRHKSLGIRDGPKDACPLSIIDQNGAIHMVAIGGGVSQVVQSRSQAQIRARRASE